MLFWFLLNKHDLYYADIHDQCLSLINGNSAMTIGRECRNNINRPQRNLPTFSDILRHSPTFSDILRHSPTFIKYFRHSPTSSDILRHGFLIPNIFRHSWDVNKNVNDYLERKSLNHYFLLFRKCSSNRCFYGIHDRGASYRVSPRWNCSTNLNNS